MTKNTPTPSTPSEVDAALRCRLLSLATKLHGDNPKSIYQGECRFGTKGALSVNLQLGCWFDHSAGTGGNPIMLVEHLKGCDQASAYTWARAWLATGIPEDPDPGAGGSQTSKSETVRALARQYHSALQDPLGTPAQAYLESRALTPPYPDCVKYLADARTGEGAVVAVLTDSAGTAVALQVGYIDSRGRKSVVEPQRRLYPLAEGWSSCGCIRIPADRSQQSGSRRNGTGLPYVGCAAITEGLEDALSVRMALNTNVCATVGVSNIGKVIPPESEVIVFRDGDEPGSLADRSLNVGLSRLFVAGRNALYVTDPGPGVDTNDWLEMSGPSGVLTLEQEASLYTPTRDNMLERAAGLDALAYDAARKKLATELGVRVSTVDQEVKQRRPQSDEPEGPPAWAPGLVDDVEPWDSPVDLATVLDDTVAALQKYVHWPDHGPETAALWAAHTHAHDWVSVSPRLAIQAPEKGCGKSVALETIGLLVPKRLTASSATSASIFRVIEAVKPTLLLDEADQFFSQTKSELLGILNSSHRRSGAYVIRTEEINRELIPRKFSTWGPICFAGIGELPSTLQDRSIVLHLQRAKPGEVAQHLVDGKSPELAEVCRKLKRWASDLVAFPDPNMPSGLYNRLGDNWRPLLTIAELAGGHWPDTALKAAKSALRAVSDDQSRLSRLLADIREIFGQKERMPSVDVVTGLLAFEERDYAEFKFGRPITTTDLARLLKGVISGGSGTIRFDRKTTRRGYRRDQFVDAWTRYLEPAGDEPEDIVTDEPAAKGETPETPKQTAETNGSVRSLPATSGSNKRNATDEPQQDADDVTPVAVDDTGEEDEKGLNSDSCYAVTDVAPPHELPPDAANSDELCEVGFSTTGEEVI